MSYYPRVLVGVILLTLVLVVAVGVARGDGGQASSPEVPEPEPSRLDAVTLIVLALVGGTALLAGSVWLSQMRRLLPQ